MLKKPAPERTALEMVTLAMLVPKDHLLRKIDQVIDFSYIQDRVVGLYCAEQDRPALDPTLMFKALMIGYLFSVRSERQLIREIECRCSLSLVPAFEAADAKRPHGCRYARFRSPIGTSCQGRLAAAARNMTKIAMAVTAKAAQAPMSESGRPFPASLHHRK
ncbi:hypothetical protein LA66_20500 [Aureimonas altamirensis]|uniref:Transposase InsH N-terminal domain-containing protein n=1 Tax=Aureimonas altamirensis TaxID=370622 RepID=A0A0B1PXX2_9HYPH|nr:transposase [Aureimonas altamirensis]KHJ52954.1 hypothetical protein LA66_20500 [Aureimonas altamirensis]